MLSEQRVRNLILVKLSSGSDGGRRPLTVRSAAAGPGTVPPVGPGVSDLTGKNRRATGTVAEYTLAVGPAQRRGPGHHGNLKNFSDSEVRGGRLARRPGLAGGAPGPGPPPPGRRGGGAAPGSCRHWQAVPRRGRRRGPAARGSSLGSCAARLGCRVRVTVTQSESAGPGAGMTGPAARAGGLTRTRDAQPD